MWHGIDMGLFRLLSILIDSLHLWTGVSSYKVDLDTKMVAVIGDILPLEVLQSVSKVKNAQFWNSTC